MKLEGITSGIKLENKSPKPETFYFFKNDANDYGQGVSSSLPTLVNPGQIVPVQLPLTWKGHVQRGNLQPATWVEFQIQDSLPIDPKWHPCHAAHGDVSLQQGYDGPASFASTDAPGTYYGGQWNGITTDILAGAPAGAVFVRSDGAKTMQTTLGNGAHAADQLASNYEWNLPLSPQDAAFKNPLLSEKMLRNATYVRGGTGVPDVGSCNNILQVTFY